MASHARFSPRHSIVLQFIALLSLFPIAPSTAAEGEGAFSRSAADIGLVVADVDKAVEYYTKAIGFKESESFTLSGATAKEIGFTEGAPLEVHVLVLGEGPSASRLKLIPVPQANAGANSQRPVKSQLGFRYITLFVADIDRAMKRMQDAGVEAPKGGPVKLGEAAGQQVSVILVRDPEGNLVELVGPRSGAGE